MQLLFNNFNPWWHLKEVPSNLTGRPRQILSALWQSLPLRQMTLITGLRRVGKTTLIFQLIDRLIRQTNLEPFHILYYSFDEIRFSLEEILTFYQTQVLRDDLLNYKRIYIFLDEIQKLPDWPEKVKILYDMHPNVKIILSGSANIVMKAGSRESLAGRFFEYPINPLNFEEFLDFKGVHVNPKREEIYQQTIQREFQNYLKTGGFIEAIPFDDAQLIVYFKDSILERVAYRDIPTVFSINVPELLIRLLNILAQRPGLYLDYKNIGNDLKVDHRTIMNYFNYLEYSFLVQKLYNFSSNLLSSEKKLKRAYLSNSGFTFSLAGEMNLPLMMEQFWINFLKSKFFYRSPQKDEVDLVHTAGDIILPIEIKMRENISTRTAASLIKFLRRFDLNRGLMISLQTEKELSLNGKIITILPHWKYWTILKRVQELTAKD